MTTMPDLANLFPNLADQLPSREGALRPIGRRRAARVRLLRPRRPSPTLVLLTEIRATLLRLEHAVEAQAALYLDIGAVVEQLRAELLVNTRERRETNEAIGRLSRQHTELRRDLNQTELHIPLRHSRRKPLG